MRTTLEELHGALTRDELIPHFQPIVDLRTAQVCGFEVLARWDHPIHGAVLPQNLIELAEKNGFIGVLSQQVFGKAFSALARAEGNLRLSINLSPIQLGHSSLVMQIGNLAEDTGFPLDRLTIEITESALLKDLENAKGIARDLKQLGCRLSLDDFGTGYSSLAHLHALPFDELKIDRSFVHQMTRKRESRKIVAAIIGLAHSLGLHSVAEGIENEEQADMILWLGGEFGQGWHYGRPASLDVARQVTAAARRIVPAKIPHPGDDWAVSSLEAFPTHRLAQLQAIYDGAPVGLCFLDTQLRYVSLNRKLAEMNGISIASHLGHTVEEVNPDFYPHIEPLLRRALRGEAISSVEVERPDPEGGPSRWMLCSYQPAFDEADEVIGVSISVIDNTPNKLAEAARSESEYTLQHIAELSRQVPWTMESGDMNCGGMELQASSVWARQIPLDKLPNLGWLEAAHHEDLKIVIHKFKSALNSGSPIDIEYRVEHPDGDWRWVRLRGSPRFASDGSILRWYGSVEDVHERKSQEEEMRKAKARMRDMLDSVPVAIVVDKSSNQAVMLGIQPLPDTIPLDLVPSGAVAETGAGSNPAAAALHALLDPAPDSPPRKTFRRASTRRASKGRRQTPRSSQPPSA
jgi:PAS domain S-box-containing protein